MPGIVGGNDLGAPLSVVGGGIFSFDPNSQEVRVSGGTVVVAPAVPIVIIKVVIVSLPRLQGCFPADAAGADTGVRNLRGVGAWIGRRWKALALARQKPERRFLARRLEELK